MKTYMLCFYVCTRFWTINKHVKNIWLGLGWDSAKNHPFMASLGTKMSHIIKKSSWTGNLKLLTKTCPKGKKICLFCLKLQPFENFLICHITIAMLFLCEWVVTNTISFLVVTIFNIMLWFAFPLHRNQWQALGCQ